MDQPATLSLSLEELDRAELARERAAALDDGTAASEQPATQPTPAPPPEPSVDAAASERPATQPAVYQSRFNLLELLELYDAGRRAVSKRDHLRWRATFALGASNNGILAAFQGGVATTLAVFWRTKNVHVDMRKEVPHLHPDGNYVYVAWFWNETADDGSLVLKQHIRRTVMDAEFIAWHDQRGRGAKRRLFVLDLSTDGDEIHG